MNTDTTEAAKGGESRTKDLLCAKLPLLHKDFVYAHGINGNLELFIFRNNKSKNIYEKYHLMQYHGQPIRNELNRVWRFIGGA